MISVVVVDGGGQVVRWRSSGRAVTIIAVVVRKTLVFHLLDLFLKISSL